MAPGHVRPGLPRSLSLMKPPDAPPTCPGCGSPKVKLATDAVYSVYLRCDECFHVWSMPKEEYLRIKKDGKK